MDPGEKCFASIPSKQKLLEALRLKVQLPHGTSCISNTQHPLSQHVLWASTTLEGAEAVDGMGVGVSACLILTAPPYTQLREMRYTMQGHTVRSHL